MWSRSKTAGWAPMGSSWSSGRKFSICEVPPEKYGVRSPSWVPQPIPPEPERNPNNIQLWKVAGFLFAKEKWLESPEPFKRSMHIISFAATYPGLQQRGRGKGTLGRWRRVWGWRLWGENWGSSHRDPCVETYPILQQPSCSGRALPSEWHQPEKNQ